MVIEAEDRRINAQAIERAEREDKRRKVLFVPTLSYAFYLVMPSTSFPFFV